MGGCLSSQKAEENKGNPAVPRRDQQAPNPRERRATVAQAPSGEAPAIQERRERKQIRDSAPAARRPKKSRADAPAVAKRKQQVMSRLLERASTHAGITLVPSAAAFAAQPGGRLETFNRVVVVQDHVFASLFEGICGPDAVRHLHKIAYASFCSALKRRKGEMGSVLVSALLEMEGSLLEASKSSKAKASSGGCAVVAVINLKTQELHAASVGGCACLVSRAGKPPSQGAYAKVVADGQKPRALIERARCMAQPESSALEGAQNHVMGFAVHKVKSASLASDAAAAANRGEGAGREAKKKLPKGVVGPGPQNKPYRLKFSVGHHRLHADDHQVLLVTSGFLDLVSSADAAILAHHFSPQEVLLGAPAPGRGLVRYDDPHLADREIAHASALNTNTAEVLCCYAKSQLSRRPPHQLLSDAALVSIAIEFPSSDSSGNEPALEPKNLYGDPQAGPQGTATAGGSFDIPPALGRGAAGTSSGGGASGSGRGAGSFENPPAVLQGAAGSSGGGAGGSGRGTAAGSFGGGPWPPPGMNPRVALRWFLVRKFVLFRMQRRRAIYAAWWDVHLGLEHAAAKQARTRDLLAIKDAHMETAAQLRGLQKPNYHKNEKGFYGVTPTPRKGAPASPYDAHRNNNPPQPEKGPGPAPRFGNLGRVGSAPIIVPDHPMHPYNSSSEQYHQQQYHQQHGHYHQGGQNSGFPPADPAHDGGGGGWGARLPAGLRAYGLPVGISGEGFERVPLYRAASAATPASVSGSGAGALVRRALPERQPRRPAGQDYRRAVNSTPTMVGGDSLDADTHPHMAAAAAYGRTKPRLSNAPSFEESDSGSPDVSSIGSAIQRFETEADSKNELLARVPSHSEHGARGVSQTAAARSALLVRSRSDRALGAPPPVTIDGERRARFADQESTATEQADTMTSSNVNGTIGSRVVSISGSVLSPRSLSSEGGRGVGSRHGSSNGGAPLGISKDQAGSPSRKLKHGTSGGMQPSFSAGIAPGPGPVSRHASTQAYRQLTVDSPSFAKELERNGSKGKVEFLVGLFESRSQRLTNSFRLPVETDESRTRTYTPASSRGGSLAGGLIPHRLLTAEEEDVEEETEEDEGGDGDSETGFTPAAILKQPMALEGLWQEKQEMRRARLEAEKGQGLAAT